LTTFSLVCFAWIFFRAKNMSDAVYIVTHLSSGLGDFIFNIGDIGRVKTILKGIGLEQSEFLIAAGAILFMESIHLVQRYHSIRKLIGGLPIAARWGIYYAAFFIILKFGVFEEQEFIYFQF